MKTKFLVGALSFALLGSAYAEIDEVKSEKKYTSGFRQNVKTYEGYKPNTYKLKPRSEKARKEKLKRSKMNALELFAYDPKNYLDAYNFVYYESSSQEIKDAYDFGDLTSKNIKTDKFGHTILEAKFTGEVLEKKELKINKLLSDCLQRLPKPQEFDNKVNGYPNLYWPTYQCTQYLYSDRYDLGDFAFSESDLVKLETEKIYALIYLHIKEAGLLRKIFYTYYPKSLLREYADQTGLTTFIHAEEKKAEKSLKHDELAAQFFGSKAEWLKDFYQFLDAKILELQIGK